MSASSASSLDAASGAAAPAEGALGVIAGAGALPRLVAEAEARAGGSVFVVALSGFAEDWVAAWPHAYCGLAQVSRLFGALRAAGCRRVCFAGGLSRPSLLTLARSLRFDLGALTLVPRMTRLLRQGDDGLLRGIAAIFEERGFALTPVQALLGELLAPAGPLGRLAPNARDLEDIERAAEIVAALGAADVGQGAVVAHGRCLAVEAVFGTDVMLRDLAGKTRRHGAPIPAGVLYKAPKPGQDQRVDLPTIGPKTLEGVKAAGLNGVALQAGAAFILDIEATARAADAAGLFVYGRPLAGEARS